MPFPYRLDIDRLNDFLAEAKRRDFGLVDLQIHEPAIGPTTVTLQFTAPGANVAESQRMIEAMERGFASCQRSLDAANAPVGPLW